MVNDPSIAPKMVVLLIIIRPAEDLMYLMFAEQRDEEWRRLPDSEVQPPLVRLANPQHSPVSRTLDQYVNLLLEEAPWTALHSIAAWTSDTLMPRIFFNIWSVISNMWRRLVRE